VQLYEPLIRAAYRTTEPKSERKDDDDRFLHSPQVWCVRSVDVCVVVAHSDTDSDDDRELPRLHLRWKEIIHAARPGAKPLIDIRLAQGTHLVSVWRFAVRRALGVSDRFHSICVLRALFELITDQEVLADSVFAAPESCSSLARSRTRRSRTVCWMRTA
jgi:hypothetical protein